MRDFNTPDRTDDHAHDASLDFVPDMDEPDMVTAEPLNPTSHDADIDDEVDALFHDAYGLPLHPVNWRTLTADEAETEWHALNDWVNWLRREFGLPASIIPPYWHRHPELVWELSALHLKWLGAYDPHQDPAAPLAWMVDFRAARERLREWVTISGTRLDRDRPTRQTTWPGEPSPDEPAETRITNREQDFAQFVNEDLSRRASAAAFLHGDIAEP
ncbi:hypothetical protein [Phytoactinopolyspora halophila]|nr:hypothetical protein [Phytoactinopolyspora halophila]